jgi:hypothetical protein
MPVTLICDHRVLDGVTAAKSLLLMEEKLRGVIADELRRLSGVRAAG